MGPLRTILAAMTTVLALVLLAPVLLLVLPFWLVSVLTRMLARAAEPEYLTREGLIQFDPVFGWRARPNLDTHHLMVDLFHIKTDRDGWRGKYSLAESHVVVFGDSFAAGYGVSDRHYFANLPGGCKIKSVGTGGYSMVQELLWMEKLKNDLDGKLVVWFVYYGNDLYDNLMPDLRGYRKPFLREDRSGGWEIISSHITPEKWPIITQGRMQGENHLPKLAELCSDTFLAKRAFAACDYLIERGNTSCVDGRGKLVVLSVPDVRQLTPEGARELRNRCGDPVSFDPDLPDAKLAAICREHEIAFYPGKNFLDASCYKTNDCHWNEHGHRAVSEILCQLFQNRSSARVARETEHGNLVVQA